MFIKYFSLIVFVLFLHGKDFAITQTNLLSSLETVNLSQGKTYTITSLVSTQYSYATNEKSYYKAGALTNGRKGSQTSFSDGEWQGYFRGGARSIVIDMGQVNTVNQIQESFIQSNSAGIYFPRKVSYALSLNGTDWADVGSVVSAKSLTSTTTETQTYTVSGLNYQARYVKMTFPVDSWVFADEFQVLGNLGIVDNAQVPQTTEPITYPDEYCPPGSAKLGGIKDMVLIYNGYYSNPSLSENTVDELLPYVGYRSTSGTIKDFMFDGFLFLPYAAGGPSGGLYYCDLKHPTKKSDWVDYLDNTFDPVYNLAALDSATEIVKTKLNNFDFKAKVEIAIPYPTNTATNFGDVDSDGVSENLSFLAEREKVIKWYVDQVVNRWDAANYANLELVGFYWYEEKACFSVDDSEAVMISYTGDYVRSKGKVLNWIPYYQSAGFAEWDSLGFDGAVMQPNYAFYNFPVQELGEAADAIKKLGMGIEIEIHWNAPYDASLRSKYYAYLDYGVTKGYMEGAVHMYYQNGGPGTFYISCLSYDPTVRNIYDQTYRFIKGTYTPTDMKEEKNIPINYSLQQNYPNPFNPRTKIKYSIPQASFVSLKVYDLLGREITTLVNEEKSAGNYEVKFDASNLASGVYFYRLQADNFTSTKKMILLR